MVVWVTGYQSVNQNQHDQKGGRLPPFFLEEVSNSFPTQSVCPLIPGGLVSIHSANAKFHQVRTFFASVSLTTEKKLT